MLIVIVPSPKVPGAIECYVTQLDTSVLLAVLPLKMMIACPRLLAFSLGKHAIRSECLLQVIRTADSTSLLTVCMYSVNESIKLIGRGAAVGGAIIEPRIWVPS